MVRKATVGALVIVIVALFAFIVSFGTFLVLKERWCAKNLMSNDCYTTYQQFMHRLTLVI